MTDDNDFIFLIFSIFLVQAVCVWVCVCVCVCSWA